MAKTARKTSPAGGGETPVVTTAATPKAASKAGSKAAAVEPAQAPVSAPPSVPKGGGKAKATPAAPAVEATAPAAAKRAEGLNKPMRASKELAAIVGDEALPRTQVVAKVWEHIKANDLQDPADKRNILADDKLRAVFGRDSCSMFEMQRLLTPHLSAA